jgi:hypothetical protein
MGWVVENSSFFEGVILNEGREKNCSMRRLKTTAE